MSQAIVITGMHRSGTSLVSSLLQKSGVDIGKQLLAANSANPRGYFEDVDFYEFHEQLLHDRGQSYLYFDPDFQFEPTPAELQRARQLVAERSGRALWGWKDPRTAVFLEFWHQLLPEARFVLVYRHPVEVLLSLLRRGEFDNHPYLAAGLHAWQLYNANIKAFYDQNSDKCLLVHIDGVVGQIVPFADLLQQKLQLAFRLDTDAFGQLYHNTELQKTPWLPEVAGILAKLWPDVFQLYEQLNAKADLAANASQPDAITSQRLAMLEQIAATLAEPIPLAIRDSLLQLLMAFVEPGPTETMLSRFYHNTKGAQQTIDFLWLNAQRLERKNGEQVGNIHQQQAQIETQRVQLQTQSLQLQAQGIQLYEQVVQLQNQQRELNQQTARLQTLSAELNRVHKSRAWKFARTYHNFREKWQKKQP